MTVYVWIVCCIKSKEREREKASGSELSGYYKSNFSFLKMWSNSTMCDMKSSCSAGYSRSLNTIWNILKSPREAVCSVCAFSVSEDSREVFRWRIFHQIKYIGLVPSANNAISSRSCCNILTFPVGRWHSVMQVEKGRVSEHSRRYRTQFESPLNAKMSIRRSQRQSYCFRVCGRQLIPCIALEGSGA